MSSQTFNLKPETEHPTPFIVSLSGKGGVGKTTLTALILDELARKGFPGPVLAVDGDPAMTLHLALGLPAPVVTVADIRDDIPLDAQTVRDLPAGVTPAGYVYRKLMDENVLMPYHLRAMPLHLLAMGRGEGRGCYCGINRALTTVLGELVDQYPLVVIDNDAGLEHLNRYRLHRVDYFLTVATPARPAIAVARNIYATARRVGMTIAADGMLLNRVNGIRPQIDENTAVVSVLPDDRLLFDMEIGGYPIVGLPDHHPLRRALSAVTNYILEQIIETSTDFDRHHELDE